MGFPARTPRTESPRWKSKWTNEKKKLGWICAVNSWENLTYLKQQQALRSLFERMKAKLVNEIESVGDSSCHLAGPQTSEPDSINRALKQTSKMICESIQGSSLGDSKITLAVARMVGCSLLLLQDLLWTSPLDSSIDASIFNIDSPKVLVKCGLFLIPAKKRTEWKNENRFGFESFSCKQLNTIMLSFEQRALISSSLASSRPVDLFSLQLLSRCFDCTS